MVWWISLFGNEGLEGTVEIQGQESGPMSGRAFTIPTLSTLPIPLFSFCILTPAWRLLTAYSAHLGASGIEN